MIENIYTIIYVLTVVVALYFLIFLLRKSKKTESSRALIWLIIFTAIWTSFEILAASEFFSESVRIYLWRSTFLFATITTFFLPRFILIFFKLYYRIHLFVRIGIFSLLIGFCVFIMFTNGIVDGILPNMKMWEVGYSKGPLYVVDVLLVAFFMISGLLISIFYYLKTKKRKIKRIYGIISLGVMFPTIMGVTTNLLLPLLGVEKFPRMANLSAVILMSVLFHVIYELNAFKTGIVRYSIKVRLTIIIILISIFSGISGFFIFYSNSLSSIKQEFYDHLETTAKSRANHIETYLDSQIETLNFFTSKSVLREELKEYQVSQGDDLLEHINKILIDQKEPMGDDVKRLCVAGIDGTVISSTDKSFIGRDISSENFFIEGKGSTNIYFIKENDVNKLFVSGPFVLNDNEIVGVGILVITIDKLNEIMADYTGLSQSSDLYVVNENKEFITPSLLLRQESVMTQKVDTINVDKCFDNKDDSNEHISNVMMDPFLNYKGIEVIGTHSYLYDNNWCVIAEVDKKEIEDKFDRSASFAFFMSLGVIVIISSLTAYFYAKTISMPVLALKKGAEELSNWNLNYKVKINSKDEFGSLAKAFNLMGLKLRDSHSLLEKTVKERTDELEQTLGSMKNSRKAMLNIMEDIEEERGNVAGEKDKIDAILHSIGDGVFVVNKNFQITMFNQVAADISGYSIPEVIGKKYYDVLKFVSEVNNERSDEFIQKAIKTGNIQEMDGHALLIRKNGGSRVAVANSAAPLKTNNGEIVGCVVVFRDVTKEREVDRAKTEFVSLASHQLRTPLSSINWYAEMLLAGDAGKINADQKEYLKEIYKGNQRMVDLVNSLLNVSRMEMGTFMIEPKKVNIIEMADSVLSELEPKIKERKMKIEKKYDKKVFNMNIDDKLMRIIFQNLLSNAVKYTLPGGTISVSIEKNVKKKEFLLKVSDTGLGIPKNQQGNIFGKLFRADNVRQTDTEGTGLGLYLVKSIMDNAGGNVWFKSKENKGTTFFVSMPLSGMITKEGTKALDVEKV